MEQNVDGPEASKKRFSKEDILKSSDVGGVMESYRRALENSQTFDRVNLQTAAADRLHQLGDEEKSFQFTILASQTRNLETSTAVAENLNGIQLGFHKDVENFGEEARGFKGSASVVEAASEKMSTASNSFSRATDRIEGAADTINKASYRTEK